MVYGRERGNDSEPSRPALVLPHVASERERPFQRRSALTDGNVDAAPRGRATSLRRLCPEQLRKFTSGEAGCGHLPPATMALFNRWCCS
ncbi:hypothetical protein AAFF_G00206640 [Aldrovandia affinis]|uniref:Uncharacterized protein n=1 Tax=Aldrovandia affinis TaxID=143900 RepID=A0AAD7RI23_9TELE|nr:hypothetical protein AAFF_G00206640 [Aldrovandia affinis]